MTFLSEQRALISIYELHRIIGISYCNHMDCVNHKGGNYTYDVPLSQYFPTAFIGIILECVHRLVVAFPNCLELF